jgi:FkbM family methyltransferase
MFYFEDIMRKQKIAIVDVIGLTYDPTTLQKYGLGGSESAVIYMAQELYNVGFDVTVFNNCIDSRATPGIYDGVEYVDLSALHTPNNYTCDIMVVSRTVIPYLPEQYWSLFNYPGSVFQQLKNSAKHKVLWLHDTFCSGDQFVEELVMNKHIDEIFTLSDFHTSYITNCDHGRRRNFEVLKNKIFMTRNGAKKYIEEVDITKKDKNLFIYNASITKGMIPLLERVWPKVKKQIPQAKLKIIGGYYRFRDGAEPDDQEKKFREYATRHDLKQLDVEFTGIIPQREIANHLANASFMIFPGAFPETFGISSLESLLYNTPIITNRFGALEETAVDLACYKIDYAIEPNVLFTTINTDAQVDSFVKTVVMAYNTPYLTMQKMNYCNIVHYIAGWDGVALQLKQHLYKKLGLYLPVDDYKNVQKLNHRIHEVYGRRFSNPDEWEVRRSYPQQHISIISPFYNAEKYVEDCILSVASQDYDNYTHYLIDDCSTDNSYEVAIQVIESLPQNLRSKFKLIKNPQNYGAVQNQILSIVPLDDNDIVMMLDGDDCLMPSNDIFHRYNSLYDGSVEFTYGSMWSVADNIPLVAQPYPKHIRDSKNYRQHKFAWNMPYTHLRTFKKYLINDISVQQFQDVHGNWFRAGGDTSIFYNLIEQAHPDKIKAVPDIVYKYNDLNPLNDYKVHGDEQTKTATLVLNNIMPTHTSTSKKKILLAIPTNKYIEPETFKSIYDLIVPDGFEITFQYFYGYQIDQIRNLIAHWASHFDYLFSVDSDIVLPNDTLVKMLSHDVDMVSGVYIQRKPAQEIVEIYRKNNIGGVSNVPFIQLQPAGLHEVDGCGFGCVLVKSEVIRKIGYPQFVYKSAIDHAHTVSEDVYFCGKAQEKGAKIYVDSTIVCNHIGNTVFVPDDIMSEKQQQNYLRYLSTWEFRKEDVDYMKKMKKTGVNPKVIYDIGACTGNWTREARKIWDKSEFILFDAMQQVEFLLKETGFKYHISVLSDESHKEIEFFENVWQPGGNSYYREVGHPDSARVFSDAHKVTKVTRTIDDVVRYNNFPLPDMIKIDVQGCEIDILKGAAYTLANCKDLLIELQHSEYNKGAPLKDEAMQFLQSIGFKLKYSLPATPFDGDYHFVRV